jgi:hypothetical protein
MTGHEIIQQNYDDEITAHHRVAAPSEHDPFIDNLPSTSVTIAAEVPYLDELAEKAVPALPHEINATVVALRGTHLAADRRSDNSRPHAA